MLPVTKLTLCATRLKTALPHAPYFLSNVRVLRNPATPEKSMRLFANYRLFGSNCLVSREEASGRVTEMTHDLGNRGGTTTPKAGDAHSNIPSRRGVLCRDLAKVGKVRDIKKLAYNCVLTGIAPGGVRRLCSTSSNWR